MAAGRRKKIIWTDQEWEKIVDLFWVIRKNNPKEAISTFYDNVMAQLPENRRRPFQQPIIERIAELVKKKNDEVISQADEVPNLQKRIEGLLPKNGNGTAYEITDHELLTKYQTKILQLTSVRDLFSRFSPEDLLSEIPTDKLLRVAIARIFSDLDKRQSYLDEMMKSILEKVQIVPQQSAEAQQKERPPRVVLVGFLGQQAREMEMKFKKRAKFHAIDKNRQSGTLPQNADVITVLNSFVSHHGILDQVAKEEARGTLVLRIDGGLSEAKRRLDEVLP